MHNNSPKSTANSAVAVLEQPALDERLMASVKMHYGSSQQEAILTLESQLNELARHVQTASQES